MQKISKLITCWKSDDTNDIQIAEFSQTMCFIKLFIYTALNTAATKKHDANRVKVCLIQFDLLGLFGVDGSWAQYFESMGNQICLVE